MSLVGTFASMSMPDLIQWARTARRSGMISVRNPADASARKIYLQDGQIVACASNDHRDYYGNYLLRLGYCNEEDVNRALAIQRESGIMVAQILVMVEKLSKEDDSERVLLRVVHPAKALSTRPVSPAGAVFGRGWSGVLTACMVDCSNWRLRSGFLLGGI